MMLCLFLSLLNMLCLYALALHRAIILSDGGENAGEDDEKQRLNHGMSNISVLSQILKRMLAIVLLVLKTNESYMLESVQLVCQAGNFMVTGTIASYYHTLQLL